MPGRSLQHALKRLLWLGSSERALLARALVAVWAFRLALWVMPIARTKAILERAAPRESPSPLDATQIGLAVSRASRIVPRATCLVQALATHWLLRRQNLRSRLHIGVLKEPSGVLLAHAWVECEGAVIIGGGGLERYTPIWRWDGV